MSRRAWLLVAIVLVLAVGAAALAWYVMQQPNPFPVSSEDQPISWQLPLPADAASSTPVLAAQIAQLKKMVGQGQYPDENILMGIANNYALVGDGRGAYESYLKAIEASSTNALAYENLGGLFARLGATSTALRAYAKAAELDPGQAFFQASYRNYRAMTQPQN